MRIAVCISGGLRTFELCKDNIINLFQRYGDVDFFIATWEKPCYTNVSRYTDIHAIAGSTIYPELLDGDDIITPDYLNSLCEFKGISIELMSTMDRLIDHCRHLPWHIMSPSRLLSQYYILDKCNSIRKDYEESNDIKYDIVVRIRPDIQLSRVPDILDPDKIYINDVIYTTEKIDLNLGGSINEMIYISNGENMDKICNVYKNWNDLWNQHEAYGERFSCKNFEFEGLIPNCEPFDFGITVVRENGNNERMGYVV